MSGVRPAGPGAGSPKRRTMATYAAWASPAVTFCSMIAGRRAGTSCPVRGSRRPGKRRCSSRTNGCSGSSGFGSSSSPARPGTASRATVAPGPQASARIRALAPSVQRWRVAAPALVRRASHTPSRPIGSSGRRLRAGAARASVADRSVQGWGSWPRSAGEPLRSREEVEPRVASGHPRSCPRHAWDVRRARSPQVVRRSCPGPAPRPWRSRRQWHGRCCA